MTGARVYNEHLDVGTWGTWGSGRRGPYLEGCEPHEPVEAVVVGGDEAWPSPQVTRLALELIVLPHGVRSAGVGAGRALQDDLCSLPGDAVGETKSGWAGSV